MRRISLSVLAGVALLGATVVLLHGVSAGLSQPAVMRVSTQLVSVAPSGLGPRAALMQRLARFRTTLRALAKPRPQHSSAPQATAVPGSQGMTCPAASGSGPGGCSIVPCAIYVGAAQPGYAVSRSAVGLAVLPKLVPAPSPGGRTPAGTCVSRPGRPPQLRWVSSAPR